MPPCEKCSRRCGIRRSSASRPVSCPRPGARRRALNKTEFHGEALAAAIESFLRQSQSPALKREGRSGSSGARGALHGGIEAVSGQPRATAVRDLQLERGRGSEAGRYERAVGYRRQGSPIADSPAGAAPDGHGDAGGAAPVSREAMPRWRGKVAGRQDFYYQSQKDRTAKQDVIDGSPIPEEKNRRAPDRLN